MTNFWRVWWRAYLIFSVSLVVCAIHGYYYWVAGSRWSLLMSFLVGLNAGMLIVAAEHHWQRVRDSRKKPLLPRDLWPIDAELCYECRERAITERGGARICLCCGDVGPATGWTWTGSPIRERSPFPPESEWCDKCSNFAVIVMDGFATCLSCGDSYVAQMGCPANKGGACLRHCGPGMPRCRKLLAEYHQRIPTDPDRTDGT